MKQERINVMGCPVDNLTMTETIGKIEEAIQNRGHLHHTVVNAGKLVLMQTDKLLKESVVNASLINADGAGIVIASKILGSPLKERVAGIDLMDQLIQRAHRNEYRIFFFGATEEIVKRVVDQVEGKYGANVVAGYRNGYFTKDQEREIAQEIADTKPHILFVAMSSPKKERFLYENRDLLGSVNFIMGVGGSFDVVAGKVKRAPVWIQNMSMEWAYRVYQEPRRMFKRYLVGNLKFARLLFHHYTQGKTESMN